MAHCHHFSRGWLLTDARLAGHGVHAAQQLAPQSAILVRSDALLPGDRRRLIRQLCRIARARRLTLFVAGVTPDYARRLGADGIHLRTRSAHRAAQARRLGLATSAPVHDAREARAVVRARITFALISPLYPTQSHPGAPTLSLRRFAQLARLTGARAVALGGMTAARHRQLRRRFGAANTPPEWAAIDAWDTRAGTARR